jgi:Skp family chaperone for outer membrane proteins
MQKAAIQRAAAVAVALSAILSTGVLAQAASIGKVDVEKINKEYKLATRYQDELQRYRAELEKQFDDFTKTSYLSSEELAELNALNEKKNPSDAEKARIQQLTDYTKTKQDRLRELEQKPENELSDAEKTEMGQLRQKETDAQNGAKAKDNDLMQKLLARQKEYADEIEKNVTSALEAISKEKNLTAVLSNDVILYGGVDITDEVLAKLNAG